MLGFLLGALAAVFVEGSGNMWADGSYTWIGPASCHEAGFLIAPPGSVNAIDKGVWVAGFHCPAPGPDPSGCVEWAGAAPDIGSCEYVSGPSATPPPVTVAATSLGVSNQDIAGTFTEAPDGIEDDIINLKNVPAPIAQITVAGDKSGRWITPQSGVDWIVAIRPQADPSIVDLYFDYGMSGSQRDTYSLNINFANGTSQTVRSKFSLIPAAPASMAVR